MFIQETIVCTKNEDGTTHLSPLGVHVHEDALRLLPFRPSRTLDNLSRDGVAVINYTDDVRVFAGCLTQRKDWPLCRCERIDAERLNDALAHTETRVTLENDDEVRPTFVCEIVHEATHRPFRGFNRAQAAVIELAILVSRLRMLAPEKITREMEYLRVACEKTAGERERLAWRWLSDKVAAHLAENQAQSATGKP